MASKEQMELVRNLLRLMLVGFSESVDTLTDENITELIKMAKENIKNGNQKD